MRQPEFADQTAIARCTSRQLEVFLAAARDCHFVLTANRLGISQAAVSSQVAALEEQLGKRLFVRRRGRKPILSDFGSSLRNEVEGRLSTPIPSAGRAEKSAAAHHKPVRVCVGSHLLDDYIKPKLSSLYLAGKPGSNHPEFQCVDSADEGADEVRSGNAELLAFTVPNPADFNLRAEILRSVKLGIFAGDAFKEWQEAPPADLSALPFVLPPENSPAGRMIESALFSVGIVCRKVAARAQYVSVQIELARQNLGLVVLFDSMISGSAVEEQNLIELNSELPTLYRTVFRASLKKVNPDVQEAEQFLREVLA